MIVNNLLIVKIIKRCVLNVHLNAIMIKTNNNWNNNNNI